MRSPLYLLALAAVSSLSHASDLSFEQAAGLAKRVPLALTAAAAPTVTIRARHNSDRRRHHARRARQQQQQTGQATDADASAGQQQDQQRGQSQTDTQSQGSSNVGGDQQQSADTKPTDAAQQQQQSVDATPTDTAKDNGQSQAPASAAPAVADGNKQSAQDQAASSSPVAELRSSFADSRTSSTDSPAATATTEDRRNRNTRTTDSSSSTTSTRAENRQQAQSAKATSASSRTGNERNGSNVKTAAAASKQTEAPKAAAAGALQPGAASLSAALAAQKSGQDAGFSSSSSALAAKFTAASDNNFGGKGSKSVSQDSLTLDKSQVAIGSFSAGNPAAGQANSVTSKNNFINFCATKQLPLMNGLQQRVISCNPIPQGVIVPIQNAPTVKWAVPVNQQTLPANKNITLVLNVKQIQTGVFTDAQGTYFSAPQDVNDQGLIIGHGHFVVNQVPSCTDTTPADPSKFVLFKGIDTAAVNGALSFTAINGFPPGTYRACSMMSSANHQPVLVSIAQRNNQDDCVCFFTK